MHIHNLFSLKSRTLNRAESFRWEVNSRTQSKEHRVKKQILISPNQAHKGNLKYIGKIKKSTQWYLLLYHQGWWGYMYSRSGWRFQRYKRRFWGSENLGTKLVHNGFRGWLVKAGWGKWLSNKHVADLILNLDLWR